MSHQATSRAWSSSASGNDLLVLLALADVAGNHDDPFDYAYPAVSTIAAMTRVSPRTVQRCLRSLEEQGLIHKTGEHVWGRGKVTIQYRIEAPRDDNETGRQSDGGDAAGTQGGDTAVSPNPPSEPSQNKKQETRASAAVDEFPEDLPEPLQDIAVQAGKILKRTAITRGQKREVTRAAVGHAVLSFPDRDHVQVARDVEYWLLHGKGATQSCADIVSRYRQFLRSSEPMAGPPLPTGVTPMHGRSGRMSNAEQVGANIRAMRAAAREGLDDVRG